MQTDAALLEEIRVYQRRLVDGEQKLMGAIGIRDSSTWLARKRDWDRLEGAYRWAVQELRSRGLEEPPL